MANKSGIQWTEATWNPVVGCTPISPGCANCYAVRETARLEAMGVAKYAGLTAKKDHRTNFNGIVRLDEKSLDQPLRWKRPRMIFVNSMSDLFHESLTNEQIDRVFTVMALSPQHTFQVLTKRAKRMHEYLDSAHRCGTYWLAATDEQWPLPNVWIGCSVENQQQASDRIFYLLGTPAEKRFISCEPMLGPMDLANVTHPSLLPPAGTPHPEYWPIATYDVLRGRLIAPDDIGLPKVDWVIVGGESGSNARECEALWLGEIVRQCREIGTPVFVKQLGAKFSDAHNGIAGASLRIDPDLGRGPTYRLKHRKGADMAEWPEYLRVRQMPVATIKSTRNWGLG